MFSWKMLLCIMIALARGEDPQDFCPIDDSPHDVQLVERYCGDGIINGIEQCDDDNNDNGDGCSSTCRVEESDPDDNRRQGNRTRGRTR